MRNYPETYGGFVLGPNGDPTNVLVSFNGQDTFIADNVGQSVPEFWQSGHNHYGRYDGGGTNRPYYSGPGA